MVFFPIGKICKYEMYMCLQNGFIKHDVPLKNANEKNIHPVSVWNIEGLIYLYSFLHM